MFLRFKKIYKQIIFTVATNISKFVLWIKKYFIKWENILFQSILYDKKNIPLKSKIKIKNIQILIAFYLIIIISLVIYGNLTLKNLLILISAIILITMSILLIINFIKNYFLKIIFYKKRIKNIKEINTKIITNEIIVNKITGDYEELVVDNKDYLLDYYITALFIANYERAKGILRCTKTKDTIKIILVK